MGIRTHINLEQRHKDWVEDNHVNLSSFVREKIEEEIQE